MVQQCATLVCALQDRQDKCYSPMQCTTLLYNVASWHQTVYVSGAIGILILCSAIEPQHTVLYVIETLTYHISHTVCYWRQCSARLTADRGNEDSASSECRRWTWWARTMPTLQCVGRGGVEGRQQLLWEESLLTTLVLLPVTKPCTLVPLSVTKLCTLVFRTKFVLVLLTTFGLLRWHKVTTE